MERRQSLWCSGYTGDGRDAYGPTQYSPDKDKWCGNFLTSVDLGLLTSKARAWLFTCYLFFFCHTICLQNLSFFLFFFFFRTLVSWPGTEPRLLAVKVLSPHHWTTTEFPLPATFKDVLCGETGQFYHLVLDLDLGKRTLYAQASPSDPPPAISPSTQQGGHGPEGACIPKALQTFLPSCSLHPVQF